MTILNRTQEHPTAEHVAAHWVNLLRDGNAHKTVKVSACLATVDPYAPTGMAKIDKLIQRSSAISSGNVYSNVQYSQILPARARLSVNGLIAIDGRPFQPGDLFERALSQYAGALQKAIDPGYAAKIVSAARRASFRVDSNTAVTVHSFQHSVGGTSDRTLIPHGYVIVDDRGNALDRYVTGRSPYSRQLIDLAKKILTFDRTDERPLLDYKDGQMLFVDPVVQEIADAAWSEKQAERPRFSA